MTGRVGILMKRMLLPLVLGATVLAGCAEQAKNVQSNYVSPSTFVGLSCSQLLSERNEIARSVNTLVEEQNKAATTDAVATGVALVLFWPAAFLLATTDDKSNALASAKGNYDAITLRMEQQRCKMPTEATVQS
ncbi:MAG: hypothetical protein AB8B51_19190 [Sedimentitalea sp.]